MKIYNKKTKKNKKKINKKKIRKSSNINLIS